LRDPDLILDPDVLFLGIKSRIQIVMDELIRGMNQYGRQDPKEDDADCFPHGYSPNPATPEVIFLTG